MSNKNEFNQKSEVSQRTERYLQFDLGQESYAIHLLTVKEVIPVPETTPLPNSPSSYIGIMNLRGQIISIIDLRKKLNISQQPEEVEEAVIIVEIQGVSIGVVVDSINRVLNVEVAAITEVPEVSSQINARYIEGVFQGDKNLTILLDLASVLNIHEIKKIQSKVA